MRRLAGAGVRGLLLLLRGDRGLVLVIIMTRRAAGDRAGDRMMPGIMARDAARDRHGYNPWRAPETR